MSGARDYQVNMKIQGHKGAHRLSKQKTVKAKLWPVQSVICFEKKFGFFLHSNFEG